MAPELRHLRYLLAVAEHGSFTRAAEELRVSQPTLSQQIRQLERTVGVQLLDRSGRTVRATDAGAVYLHHARRALRDLAAAERAVLDVADLSRGTLRLAMTPTFTAYLLGPLVAELHLRHPGITLDVKEMTQAQLESGLLADALDLAVAFAGPHLAGIAATELFTETLGMAVGDAHPLAGRTAPLPAADLAQCDLALLSGGFATRTHIDGYFAAQRIAPRIAVEANSLGALTEIVRRTALATVLPDALARDQPGLHPVGLTPALPARTVVLLRRESAYESAAARAFTALARDWAGPRKKSGAVPPRT
ncbi:transcriptional regulator CynR [Streptomyces sp. NBC_00536]|uniref:transcriptional regulator CynR n=1 Tax=Streptomyces sp. NBC_00536 TaxID=2975769 RepID=UPI002E80815F|nr:transcriptional regulator CynR [Streptomyces sp. NBC_00536]WUC82771.1 transcriptional regulator CynR [Streptomyces sp. NBC_00536]